MFLVDARYSRWFLAAAIYNAAWGTMVALAPSVMFDAIGMHVAEDTVAWRVVGMMVLTFAPCYWWASRDPWRHRHLIVLATGAKLLGTVGFVVAVASGELPVAFAVITLGNDVIWLPAFAVFVGGCARARGWRALLSGA
jgi:small multidrug resistance pump